MYRERRQRTSRGEGERSRGAEPIPVGEDGRYSSHSKPSRTPNDDRRSAVHADPPNTDRPVELPTFSRRSVPDTDFPNGDANPERPACVPAVSYGGPIRSLPLTARCRRPGIGRQPLTVSATRASAAHRRQPIRSRKPRSGATRETDRTEDERLNQQLNSR